MAYTIVKSDGTVLTTIADGTINTTSTSLGLPGRNYAGYGQSVDTNFVHQLENFADSTPPPNPLRGQLWFNTNNNTLYVCPTDGESNAAAWITLASTATGGTTAFGNISLSGNLVATNITANSDISANSVTTNYITAVTDATLSNANIATGTIGSLTTTSITTGSQSTNGTLTGVWTANGAGTANSIAGTSMWVTGGNLVITGAGNVGVKTDYFYYSNGTPYTFSSYGNTEVASYLPTFVGTVGTGASTFRGTSLTSGANTTAGSITGNWTLTSGSQLQATTAGTAGTVTASAQPNVTSVGTLTSLAVTGAASLGNVSATQLSLSRAFENWTVSATSASGTINYDVLTQTVLYYTSNASGNWTLNFRGNNDNTLNSILSTGQSVTVVFMVTNGGTAYYNNVVRVDGVAITPKYQGGTAWSSGNANGVDVYTYVILKTGNAAFTVFASQTEF